MWNAGNHGFIVLGVYRSGTSLVAKLLSELGIDFGPVDKLAQATSHHPHSYFERSDIGEINSNLIISAGYNLCQPGHPQDIEAKSKLSMLDSIKDYRWMQENAAWGIKDPRLCITLSSWFHHNIIDPNKVSIINVVRDTEEVTNNVFNDPLISRYCDSTHTAIKKMIKHYTDMAKWHIETYDLPVLEIQHEKLMNDHELVINDLAKYVGQADDKKIKKLVSRTACELPNRKSFFHRAFIQWPAQFWKTLRSK